MGQLTNQLERLKASCCASQVALMAKRINEAQEREAQRLAQRAVKAATARSRKQGA